MFKGISNIFEFTTTEVIDINLKYWLDYSFLEIGSFFNVEASRLKPVEDKSYSKGQVWQGFRSNWIWESGLGEVRPSGAYINGNFTTQCQIDYPRGRVIFDNPVSVNSTVTTDFSYKWINIYSSNEVDWFNDLQGDSLRTDQISYTYGSGETYKRIQLPAIIYEIGTKSFKPYQLGLGVYSYNVIVMRVFAETRAESERIADILSEQHQKTIFLFNPQLLKESGTFPLNARGFLNSGALTYPSLIEPVEDGGYRWRKMYMDGAIKQETDQLKNNLFHTPVRFTAELVLTDI